MDLVSAPVDGENALALRVAHVRHGEGEHVFCQVSVLEKLTNSLRVIKFESEAVSEVASSEAAEDQDFVLGHLSCALTLTRCKLDTVRKLDDDGLPLGYHACQRLPDVQAFASAEIRLVQVRDSAEHVDKVVVESVHRVVVSRVGHHWQLDPLVLSHDIGLHTLRSLVVVFAGPGDQHVFAEEVAGRVAVARILHVFALDHLIALVLNNQFVSLEGAEWLRSVVTTSCHENSRFFLSDLAELEVVWKDFVVGRVLKLNDKLLDCVLAVYLQVDDVNFLHISVKHEQFVRHSRRVRSIFFNPHFVLVLSGLGS